MLETDNVNGLLELGTKIERNKDLHAVDVLGDQLRETNFEETSWIKDKAQRFEHFGCRIILYT